MEAAIDNAEQWLKDAQLLLSHKSYRHAVAAARFAIEETSKILLLTRAARLRHNAGKLWKKFWGDFRTHFAKGVATVWFHVMEVAERLLSKSGEDPKHVILEAARDRLIGRFYDNELREFAIYSEFVEGRPFYPPELNDPVFAFLAVVEARAVVDLFSSFLDCRKVARSIANDGIEELQMEADTPEEFLAEIHEEMQAFREKPNVSSGKEEEEKFGNFRQLFSHAVEKTFATLPQDVKDNVARSLEEDGWQPPYQSTKCTTGP